MAALIPDTLDFSAYLRDTEAAVKVRKASAFCAELLSEFEERTGPAHPTMFSTKLDGRIEFRPGEVTAWTGYNGHRKSMFTGQCALDLCVQGQRVLIASLEMSPGKTLARMARQAAGTAKPEPGWLEAFGRWTDGRLWLFDHLGRIKPDQIIAVARYFADELKGQHMVIDSMMMVCESEESMDAQKQMVTDLVRTAMETGLHIHLVTHCRKPQTGEEKRPSKYDIRGAAAISDQVSNVITVWANKAKAAALERNPHDMAAMDEPDAVVAVEKQRNGEWEGAVKLWFHGPSLRFCNTRADMVAPYTLGQA